MVVTISMCASAAYLVLKCKDKRFFAEFGTDCFVVFNSALFSKMCDLSDVVNNKLNDELVFEVD